MLYSFDVFDTLITRTTATPQGIFAIVDHILKTEYPEIAKKAGQDFCTIRVNAETTTFRVNNSDIKEDWTLDDIYRRMAWMTALSDDELKFVRHLELQAEEDNVVAITENIVKVKEHIAKGERVVLISDMYLPSEEIRRLLVKCDPVFEKIPIYVSGECGYKKCTGNLYRYVRRQEKDWLHIGDNRQSDVEMPQSLGMKAIYYQYEALLDCERAILQNREREAALQLFIGASRNERLLHSSHVASKLGSSYGAAILFQYTNWVLELCGELSIRKLYFVARDGYILLKIAELIKKYCGNSCEFRYVYGSRKAWRLAAVISEEYYDLEGYLRNEKDYAHLSLRKLAEALDMEIDTVRVCLRLDADFPIEEEYNCFDEAKANPYLHINDNAALKKAIVEKNKEKRRLLDGYLRQELDLNADRIGFVEIHGDGVTQDYLGKYISTMSDTKISSFYYILEKNVSQGRHTFYSQQKLEKDLGAVIEVLTRAFHGRTVGYKQTERGYEPKFLDDENQYLEEYGYRYYYESVVRTVEAFLCAMNRNRCNVSEFQYAHDYNDYLLHREDGVIFEYICDMPITNTIDGKEKLLAFAPRYSEEEIEAVKEKGYICNCGLSNTFSMRRCTEEEKRRINRNQEIYRQNRLLSAQGVVNKYKVNALKLKKKVALYGAGRVGSSLYEDLIRHTDVCLIVWVDKKFECKTGLKDTVSHLTSYNFEQVIVGVRGRKLAEDIITDLLTAGIDEDKIYWEEWECINSSSVQGALGNRS